MDQCGVSTSRAHLAYARQRARRRFGSAVCGQCGEPDELTFNAFDERVLCRRCMLLVQDLPPEEDDHPFGRRNDPQTRRMDANYHAILTALQSYWPRMTQQGFGKSERVKLAAGLRRLNDILALNREQSECVSKEIDKMVRALEQPGSKRGVTE